VSAVLGVTKRNREGVIVIIFFVNFFFGALRFGFGGFRQGKEREVVSGDEEGRSADWGAGVWGVCGGVERGCYSMLDEDAHAVYRCRGQTLDYMIEGKVRHKIAEAHKLA